MSVSTPSELKKLLLAEGFEVYRTQTDRVVLADRVRDNLIMDSGVAAQVRPALGVRFTARAQASDFPGHSPDVLLDRARELASDAMDRGYREARAESIAVPDPGDSSQTLDVWHEVAFDKAVADDSELIAELRYALTLPKTVPK